MKNRLHLTSRPLAALFTGVLLLVAAMLAWSSSGAVPHADAQPQDTPVPLDFPTFTPLPGPPTETATRTPTSEGRPYIEALTEGTNVRAGPDINDPVLGKINPGTFYTVIGQRFDWFLIEYFEVPGGTAWVYSGVVALSGDESLIEVYDSVDTLPTSDPGLAAVQGTSAALTQTPGLDLTLTQQAQITPTGVLAEGDEAPVATATLAPGERLPTFTPPANTPTPVIIPSANPSTSGQTSGIPPLLPVMALGALGLMGLLVAIMRRL